MDLNQHLTLITAFLDRPNVSQYLVGITSNVKSRKVAYRRVGFDFFEVLSCGHSRDKAIELEKAIFEIATTAPNLKAKYHHAKRDKPYRASTGGRVAENYSVYVAGFAP